MKDLFDQIGDARSLAQMMVDTSREPLLVLDDKFAILFGSASFYRGFQLAPEHTRGRHLFDLDDGAWNLPALHSLLEVIVCGEKLVESFEIAHEFPRIGQRILLLHARNTGGKPVRMLLEFEDLTERRAVESERQHLKIQAEELLQHKEMLLEEMQHRIVNSLQIIASILMMKARAVTSDETRQHLQDAHRRVVSVAAVQRHLHSTGSGDQVEVAPYLSKLCASLTQSMIGGSHPAVLNVTADEGQLASADAVSVGLIVTELVINALKHAFPDQKLSSAVTVSYQRNGSDWKLTVSDNGVGKPEVVGPPAKGGLGTSLVTALAHQLDAQVETISGPEGLSVSITHATFNARTPLAA